MGQELERRLDENKYKLYEALKALYNSDTEMSWAIQQQVQEVLAKIEGK